MRRRIETTAAELTSAGPDARNPRMSRPAQAAAALAAVMRNRELRLVELAWGASIVSEWAHFVALGVFAYNAGGQRQSDRRPRADASGCRRRAARGSLGDRFPRERILVATALVGACALAGSAAAFFAGGSPTLVYALAAVIGITSTLFRPAMQAVLPSLARTPQELIAANGASSTIEILGTLAGPLLAGVLVAADRFVFAAAAGTLLWLCYSRRCASRGVIQPTAASKAPASTC
jgi:MFS family permease